MVIINSFRHPESAIKHEQGNVRAILDKKDLGAGTIFISESMLCWQEKNDVGFSVDYHDISLHAISRDVNVHPRECLYIIIDSHFTLAGTGETSRSTENESDSDCDSDSNLDISELILVPEDPVTIPTIYEALKECQELNPDSDDMDDDDVEEDDNIYVDAEDEMGEGHCDIEESGGGGDAEVDELSRRIQGDSVNIHYNSSNGNGNPNGNANDDEFEDAD